MAPLTIWIPSMVYDPSDLNVYVLVTIDPSISASCLDQSPVMSIGIGTGPQPHAPNKIMVHSILRINSIPLIMLTSLVSVRYLSSGWDILCARGP